MDSPRILVVGASCRALAQCAVRSGWDVVALDQFCDRDLASVAQAIPIRKYPDSIFEQAMSIPACHLMLAGGMENHPQLVDSLARRFRLLGPHSDQIIRLRCMDQWQTWAKQSSLMFPSTFDTPPIHEQGEWLWKPRKSSGGFQIQRFSDLQRAKENLAQPSFTKGYWQKFVPGLPMGCVMICDSRHTKTIAISEMISCTQWPGPTLFGYRGSIYPASRIPHDSQLAIGKSMEVIGESIRCAINYRGLLQMDILLGDDGKLHLLEINPRWTSSMDLVEIGLGVKLVDLHIRAIEEKVIELAIRDITPKSYIAKAIFYTESDMMVSDELSNYWMQKTHHAESGYWFADIPAAGSRLALGSPCLTIYAQSESRHELERLLHLGRSDCLR